MSYIYAALVLQAMEKEINEVNLNKIVASMNLLSDEAETEALLALMNYSTPKGIEVGKEPSLVSELRRLASQIEALSDRERINAYFKELTSRVPFSCFALSSVLLPRRMIGINHAQQDSISVDTVR